MQFRQNVSKNFENTCNNCMNKKNRKLDGNRHE